MSLPNLIRLVRGDTLHDPLPNKALSVSDHLSSWKSYESRGGVKSSQQGPTNVEDSLSEPNVTSTESEPNAIIKNLRKGQDDNRYFILVISLRPVLEGITCNPFGAVPKGDVDLSVDARVILDLS
ncbi:hypothetical protein GQ600_5779 [Phytophthora cactorum]|nr:hypothetical protein GQ600_5779 [Phytophthora cactorum]